jgi:fumarate hydratase class I
VLSVAEFAFTELLPTGPDVTEYRAVSDTGISRHSSLGRDFLEVDPAALTLLTSTAMHDIAHLLRPAHLKQLRSRSVA